MCKKGTDTEVVTMFIFTHVCLFENSVLLMCTYVLCKIFWPYLDLPANFLFDLLFYFTGLLFIRQESALPITVSAENS
jgi:hypothetical protein